MSTALTNPSHAATGMEVTPSDTHALPRESEAGAPGGGGPRPGRAVGGAMTPAALAGSVAAFIFGAAVAFVLAFVPGLRTLNPTERAWLTDGHRDAMHNRRRKP